MWSAWRPTRPQPFELCGLHRVNPFSQQVPRFQVPFSSLSKSHIRVFAQRHQLQLAVETVLKSPELASTRSDVQVQTAAIREFGYFQSSLCFKNLSVREMVHDGISRPALS